MRAGNIYDTLRAVQSAVLLDLPDYEYEQYLPSNKRDGTRGPIVKARIQEDELEVFSFPQSWGSTALGFGGMGGCAVTTAQTTVVMARARFMCALVYFGNRLAYKVETPNERFWEDLSKRRMVPLAEAALYERLHA